MPLGVLNNISAIYAENNLNQTQASLQNTLTQLSSGSRINSGADDPAGLSIANGLAANSAALTQSSSNASEGVGFLQVADGALAQVTSLLTSAVTLATEAGGGTLSGSQMSAANQEYQDILSQIGTIGSTTEYNGIQVFGSDQTTSALTWGANAVGTASSATGSSAAVASGAITAGGATAAAAPAQTTTYGTPAAMSWTLDGSSTTSTLTSGAIANGAQLSGTLAFTPTASGGTAASISINLADVTGSSLTAQAASLQTLINDQAGNGNQTDYTVTVVGNDMLQIGLGSTATADHIGGFSAAPTAGVNTSGAAAAESGFTLGVVDGGTLGGTLSVVPTTATAAGTPTDVNFSNGATVTATIVSGDNLTGSVTIQGTIPASGGVATALSWSHSGVGAAETFSTTVNTANTLTGSFTITGTGDGHSPYTVDLSGLAGEDNAQVENTIEGDITNGGGTASDYTVTYNSGTGDLTIGLSGGGTETGIAVANTGGNAATQTTPVVPSSTTASKTLNFDNVTTANLASTLNAQLSGSDYEAAYNSGTGVLTFSNSAAGTAAGVTSIAVVGSPTVTQQTPASTTTGNTVGINLANVTTANLASTVATALNGAKTTTADYAVSYSDGLLTVGLTSYGMNTDNIASVATSGALTESTPNAATIAFTDGEQLSGEFTITPTISGVAASGSGITTVDLNGVNTSNLVSTVNAALGSSASNYTVSYSASHGVGTLSIAVNATGLAANYDSVAIANGTSTNAMGESGVAITNVNSANTVMGNFTVTPTTAGGAGAAVNVDLQGVSNANLLSTVQSALGANYTVSYNTTTGSPNLGDLDISISSAGAAAGITSFTVAEAASQAASQETPVTGGVNIYTGDGTSTGSKNYNVTVGTLSDAAVGTSAATSALGTAVTTTVGGVTGTGGVLSGAGSGTSLTGTTLTSQAAAEAALQTVDDAVNAVAYQRGQVGANINTLTAASNIASSQQTNITSAENTITATDYAATTSNMSKYEILTQTGISALAQANSTQQMVTKLLQ